MFIRFGEPAGRSARLPERRVDATAHGVDQLRQRVDIGRFQLRKLAVLEDQADDRVLLAQRLERVRIGRVAGLGPLADRKAQVLEQDFRQLLRSVEVELLACDLLHLRLDRGQLPGELFLHLFEIRHVDRDALRLHVGEHAGERQLDLVEQVVDSEIAHLGLESRPQVEDRFRAASGELGRFVLTHRRRFARGAARAEQLLGAHQLHGEELSREILQPRIT